MFCKSCHNFFTLSFLQNLWYTVAEVIPMITISDLALQYSGTFLFQHVDLQFTAGNCYGVIGANGAGKSTFLKLLSGELDSTKGTISIKPGLRMSVL